MTKNNTYLFSDLFTILKLQHLKVDSSTYKMLCCILKGTKIWIKKKKQRGGAKNSTVERKQNHKNLSKESIKKQKMK